MFDKKNTALHNFTSMAISFKLFLDEMTAKGNGQYALKIRVKYNRKHRVVPLNVLLQKEDWNTITQKVKPSHPNAKLINIKVNQTLNEIQEKALKFEHLKRCTRWKTYLPRIAPKLP